MHTECRVVWPPGRDVHRIPGMDLHRVTREMDSRQRHKQIGERAEFQLGMYTEWREGFLQAIGMYTEWREVAFQVGMYAAWRDSCLLDRDVQGVNRRLNFRLGW
jgi:hypothetical protein